VSESPPTPPPEPDDRAAGVPTLGNRLDPDLAAEIAGRQKTAPAAPVIDTRRYRWTIGILGLVLVAVISVYQFASHGLGSAGVPAGQRLHYFAAPLATSSLRGDANLSKPCSLGRLGASAVNTCLLVRAAPLVLAFFVPASEDCKRQVDVLQAVSHQFPSVRFAAVAVRASQAQTATLVHTHHWTIPVAYDRDGAVGDLYGVAICPLVELAARGGVVRDRLVGDRWLDQPAFTARVRALAGR
jgi:hypothetical protein